MKKIQGLFLTLLCLGFLGTTFVIKEGGKEVGRYEENDGKTGTVEMNNDVPVKTVPAPKPKKAAAAAAPAANPMTALETFAARKAEEIAAPTRARNDARTAEAMAAQKEMEEGYK